MSKIIKLTKGYEAIVDDEDFDRYGHLKWHVRVTVSGAYAKRSIRGSNNGSGSRTVYLHKEILRCESTEIIDHKNGNTLDNRKDNLRVCSRSQNVMNSCKTKKEKTSIYKGVHLTRGTKRWRASIRLNRKPIFIGDFYSEKEAAIAYNKAAEELFGDFARLNNIED